MRYTCFHPIEIKNPAYIKACKDMCHTFNGKTLPNWNPRDKYISVPCGKCLACLYNRAQDWICRLKEECKSSASTFFLTLTYAPEFLPKDGSVNKRDVQLFLKRLRKSLSPISIRYFLVSEYGTHGTLRPHYHALIFCSGVSKNQLSKAINKAWFLGFTTLSNVTSGRIYYVSMYSLGITKFPEGRQRPFMLCSRRPAIGASFLEDDSVHKYYHDNLNAFLIQDGFKVSMPRYFKERIFSKEEIELLKSHAQEYLVLKVSKKYSVDFVFNSLRDFIDSLSPAEQIKYYQEIDLKNQRSEKHLFDILSKKHHEKTI